MNTGAIAAGSLAAAKLLTRIAEYLEDIDGLTDGDILDITVRQSSGWEGRPEIEATVYYSSG